MGRKLGTGQVVCRSSLGRTSTSASRGGCIWISGLQLNVIGPGVHYLLLVVSNDIQLCLVGADQLLSAAGLWVVQHRSRFSTAPERERWLCNYKWRYVYMYIYFFFALRGVCASRGLGVRAWD